MSKAAKRVLKNSFFQTAGAFTQSILTFTLSLGYARILGPETYGSLITSQAQVLVWLLLVDLGLSNSFIGALTSAEGERSNLLRQGFRARDLLFRVLLLRLVGALTGTLIIFVLATLRFHGNPPAFLQEVAFTPQLFAMALQQTSSAYAAYHHKQGLSVLATMGGMLLTTALALELAFHGASVPWILLAQSWGGFFSATVVFGYFLITLRRRRQAGATRRQPRLRPAQGPWGSEAWKALARDSWPYALAIAVFSLWQRLDQLAASHILGLAQGGQYALAVRLVSVPLLIATAASIAVFPDLQRVGRDAPHRVKLILSALSKAIYRFGIPAAGIMVCAIALVVWPLVPKFRQALWLLPWFLPGIWAFWLQIFIVNSLFGLREFRQVAFVHLKSLAIYAVCVFTLPAVPALGLVGVAWAFDIFCLCMFGFAFQAAREVGLLEKKYLIYSAFTLEERQLLDRTGLLFLSRPREGA